MKVKKPYKNLPFTLEIRCVDAEGNGASATWNLKVTSKIGKKLERMGKAMEAVFGEPNTTADLGKFAEGVAEDEIVHGLEAAAEVA